LPINQAIAGGWLIGGNNAIPRVIFSEEVICGVPEKRNLLCIKRRGHFDGRQWRASPDDPIPGNNLRPVFEV
jgi:hypothetical protein